MFKLMFNDWLSITPLHNYGTYCMEAVVNYSTFTDADVIYTNDIPF